MTIDKQALRKELSNPAIGSNHHLRKLALSLLDELEIKEEQRTNWFQMAQKLGEDLDEAEKRIAELAAKLANPVLLPKTNGYWTEQEKAFEDAITLAKRKVRLAGFRCEEDE